MDCPRDNTEMTELTDGEDRLLFRCAECGGLWLDAADLNRILLHDGLPTLEAMGGRANPEEDAGDCPVDSVGLLAVESQHKRNPLVYGPARAAGASGWSRGISPRTGAAEDLTKGIVEFYREFSVTQTPGTKAARK